MSTITRPVNDPVINAFKHEEKDADESLTSLCLIPSTKDEGFEEAIHKEIDALFKEIERESTYVINEEDYYDNNKTSISANEERIKLLSRKYIRDLSKEEFARLEILCERVRQLFPRATTDDFKKLEIIGKELKELKEDNKKIRDKFYLD